ncbi:hypothetical protein DNTS_031996 [Danionella cerebrum]|uniref:Uncharacterized protein n=1 Tax=Danionella cerebrum TaxID=2873325 RepID=A0A553PYP0_9TELE|nr:hypothetical protein DNTS_031996 [Danionella translucida]
MSRRTLMNLMDCLGVWLVLIDGNCHADSVFPGPEDLVVMPATSPNVVDLYWGIDPEEWDSPELQRLRMKLLEECLKTSAGPCFVVGIHAISVKTRLLTEL